MRTSTSLFILVAALVGVLLFQVKYRVATLEGELAAARQAILTRQEAIKVLNAEWSYLTEPKRIQGLTEKFLALKPLQPTQLASLAEVIKVIQEENLENAEEREKTGTRQ